MSIRFFIIPGFFFHQKWRGAYHAVAGVFLNGEYLPELSAVPVIRGQAVDVERLGVKGGECDVARVEPVADDVVRGADEAAVEQVSRLRGGVA